MATSKFKGPINSVNGFYFHPALWTSARPMTVTCTSIIRAAAASGVSCTLTNAMCGGLSKVTAGWANRRRSTTGTTMWLCVRPLGAANSAVVNAYGNEGVGQIFHGGANTIDVFLLGYVS